MEFVAFDFETTGLQEGSRPVHLAAIKFNEMGEIHSDFETYINPEMPIPADIPAVNGVTDDHVRFEPVAAVVLPRFFEWVRDATLVAHYARYDVGIANWSMRRAGISAPSLGVVCTLDSAKQLGGSKSYSLDALVDMYGITRTGKSHTAMSDADACMQVFLAMRCRSTVIPWLSVPVGYSYVPPSAFPSAWPTLDEVVARGGQVEMAYIDKDGGETTRVITPYGWALAHRKGGDALVIHGWCHLRNERRTFNVDSVAWMRPVSAQEAAA